MVNLMMQMNNSASVIQNRVIYKDSSTARLSVHDGIDKTEPSNVIDMLHANGFITYSSNEAILNHWSRLNSAVLEFASDLNNKHLHAALSRLANIDEQLERGDVPPTPLLFSNVEGLIKKVYQIMDLPMDVFATPEGDITLSLSTQPDNLIFFDCHPDGSVYCMIKIDGERTRRTFPDITQLPESFITTGLTTIQNA